MSDWLVQHLRLSVMTEVSEALVPEQSDTCFETIFGVEAEVDERRKKPEMRRRCGARDEFRYELREAPSRFDLFWGGPTPLEAMAEKGEIQVASIGKLKDVLPKFITSVADIFPMCQKPIRLALGGLIYLPVATTGEGYKVMQKLVPSLDLTYGKVSDFQLQINRPVESEVKTGTRINRLSVLNSPRSSVIFGAGAVINETSSGYHWTQIVEDINTDPANKNVYSDEECNEFIRELGSHFEKISRGEYD